MQVVGYARVSTNEQGESGAGLEAQRIAITAMCTARSWTLTGIHEDVASGKTRRKRPGLDDAIAVCERGDADGLIVAKLDRLARSTVDFGKLLEHAKRKRFAVVALDVGIDTSTANGKLVANMLMSVAEWESERIAERTRDALAVKRSQGVKLGGARRPSTAVAVRRRIARHRRNGLSYGAIAARLNADRVPTTQGGAQWWPMTVRTVLLAKGGRS
jgi:DNA invertase Pin-like site-specific DNA recombinase